MSGPDGKAVRLDVPAPRWTLDWWIDSATVVGVAIHGPGRGDDIGAANSSSLMTCTVPAGACQILDGSTGARMQFPNGTTEPSTVSLLGDE